MSDTDLSPEELRVLTEMVAAGQWHVPSPIHGPDPICTSLAERGLARGSRLRRDEYIRQHSGPDHYVATSKGFYLVQSLK